MIERSNDLARVQQLLRWHRAVAVVGPRQAGKTTLAREIARRWKGPSTFIDLESESGLARLASPELVLRELSGLVVIDEVQRLPSLFPALRVVLDRPRPPKLLLLGSASPDLRRQASESLAGRIAYHSLLGLSLDDVGVEKLDRLWVRGGFPRSFVARSEAQSLSWRREFVTTFLQRDVPAMGVRVPAAALHRLWMMLAHLHGQTLNTSELGRALDVGDATVRHHLDILADGFVVRRLPPWFSNISKRQVKAPKVYVADSGILHALLGIETRAQLLLHPAVGASWEGFAIEAILRHLGAREDEAYFWATHAGAELDLVVSHGGKLRGFEIKRTLRPTVTPSMRHALEDLDLVSLDVIHAGEETFPLTDRVRAVALRRLPLDVRPLSGRP